MRVELGKREWPRTTKGMTISESFIQQNTHALKRLTPLVRDRGALGVNEGDLKPR